MLGVGFLTRKYLSTLCSPIPILSQSNFWVLQL